MLNRSLEGKASLTMTEYYKSLLDNANEVKHDDVLKFVPKRQAAKKSFEAWQNEVKKALNLEA